MNETVETIVRVFCVQLNPVAGTWPPVIRIKADKMSKSVVGGGKTVLNFKRDEQDVGVVSADVAAWWICEETE